jgi:hypothetical protein
MYSLSTHISLQFNQTLAQQRSSKYDFSQNKIKNPVRSLYRAIRRAWRT